ncbi:hypothetical protein [Brevibacillus fulvus]|uniref:Uncharacterized protein n=1 Tax=Brevibacillus fulvus TaxID=1125967 RepID=A0A938Y0X5_9BACL|nr:hypothetical protein [Brevibacillus fulvus]MBM7591290.1 hypothetical protein [Brevibacillus fulvus]
MAKQTGLSFKTSSEAICSLLVFFYDRGLAAADKQTASFTG